MIAEDDGPEVKLLQVFLSKEVGKYFEKGNPVKNPFIFEVSIHKPHKLKCNCPDYHEKHPCKHILFVSVRLDEAGEYPPVIDLDLSEEDLEAVESSNETFRTHILEHGRVEVI